jgi:hypothetical protein
MERKPNSLDLRRTEAVKHDEVYKRALIFRSEGQFAQARRTGRDKNSWYLEFEADRVSSG